ncbi:CPBP family intramembrane glutamic endopeptidase [Aphanothece hegewaldii]|uniref:CPBP family intramembrane glutamic endopeptidase n=1 Tax=Aphanothece hegewaldii TaxID=1521625 RepID=UPI001FEC81FC|nr:CPBP family intramembrane glutamic endopeptidase [Aphanothece hegewaldii]
MAIPIYFFFRSDPNLVTILTMVILYAEFLWLLRRWSRQVHHHDQGLTHYGIMWTHQNRVEFINGLSIGFLLVWLLFIVEAVFSWVTFKTPTASIGRIILEGLIVSFGIGFAEELFFRGWILDELEKDYNLTTAIWETALLYSSFHFLKPIAEIIRTFPQFPALVLLGLTLGITKHLNRGRLGMSIGIHGGLVWGYYVIQVGQLITYTNTVSPLITGVDRNPLAGVMGLFFLSILYFVVRRKQSLNP